MGVNGVENRSLSSEADSGVSGGSGFNIREGILGSLIRKQVLPSMRSHMTDP